MISTPYVNLLRLIWKVSAARDPATLEGACRWGMAGETCAQNCSPKGQERQGIASTSSTRWGAMPTGTPCTGSFSRAVSSRPRITGSVAGPRSYSVEPEGRTCNQEISAKVTWDQHPVIQASHAHVSQRRRLKWHVCASGTAE